MTVKEHSVALLLLLTLSSPVYAQRYPRFECKPDLSTGFFYDEASRTWRMTGFDISKKLMTLRHLTDAEIRDQLPFERGKEWGVFAPGQTHTILLCDAESTAGYFSCGGEAISFVLNTNTRRFEDHYAGGYVSGSDDNDNTPYMEIGRCRIVQPSD